MQLARVERAYPRLHPHQLHLGACAPQGDPHPARKPAAADRDDHARQVGHVLEQLHAQRPLAGDHIEVVEGMHERRARPLRVPLSQGERLLDRVALQVHTRAQTLDRCDLRHGSVARHVHVAGEIAHARGLRERARVVSGARRDQPAGGRLPQGRHLAERAAQLERAGALQALGLQHHPHARKLGQLVAGNRGSPDRHVCDRAAGARQVGPRDQICRRRRNAGRGHVAVRWLADAGRRLAHGHTAATAAWCMRRSDHRRSRTSTRSRSSTRRWPGTARRRQSPQAAQSAPSARAPAAAPPARGRPRRAL